jgi:hypothetical protein
MTDWNPFDYHRGPYVFGVIRETPTRKLKWHYDLLPGNVEVDDIRDEARALLSDPRDTITSVIVFSVHEQRHVTTYKRRDFGLV